MSVQECGLARCGASLRVLEGLQGLQEGSDRELMMGMDLVLSGSMAPAVGPWETGRLGSPFYLRRGPWSRKDAGMQCRRPLRSRYRAETTLKTLQG